MIKVIGTCLLLLFTFGCIKKKNFIETNVCSDICYEVVGQVLNDSSKLPLENATAELLLEHNWKNPYASFVETDSLGGYKHFVEDSLISKGFSKGRLVVSKSFYLRSEVEYNLDNFALGKVLLPKVHLLPASLVKTRITINNDEVSRIRLLIKTYDSTYVEYMNTTPNSKPLVFSPEFSVPSNKSLSFSVEYSKTSAANLVAQPWVMLDSFPKDINLYHKQKVSFLNISID
ncbi:hypothetical protein DNU06_07600 [Putridiphycobacter roseus]|uniref:DUF3823 domain-containing protein n=1 Tax=Putridiphycobacter roseus TaxID=2219161 RepID=A0A2W1NE36_9FLAO|nr:hypothetical protein [Putridiphycobacter roseus]PZE17685.1 hypothetical protein DNU06_07600 [Putridiphycobacter roseus]